MITGMGPTKGPNCRLVFSYLLLFTARGTQIVQVSLFWGPRRVGASNMTWVCIYNAQVARCVCALGKLFATSICSSHIKSRIFRVFFYDLDAHVAPQTAYPVIRTLSRAPCLPVLFFSGLINVRFKERVYMQTKKNKGSSCTFNP